MPKLPSNLNIRRARDGDLPEMARLHYASFPGSDMTLEGRISHFRENPRIDLEDYWVCERKGHLVGMFALYDFKMFRMGHILPTGGIGSVAVAAEARRERLAYHMMARAVEIMDQNGMPLSILYPFRHNFYRKLGWGLIGRVSIYRFAPESLPNYDERSDILPVTTQEDQEEVMGCYNEFSKRGNGLIQRSEPQWFEMIFKNSVCYAYREPNSGEIEGYLTFRYRPHSPDEGFVSTDLEVWDFVYNSRRALKGLLGFLASQRDQVKVVHLPEMSGLPLEYILMDPRMPGGTHSWLSGAETAAIGTSLMGRVVNLRRALNSAGRFAEMDGKLTLNIRDELNPANAEIVTLVLEEGKVSFPKDKSSEVSLSMDISTFSSLYWGALGFSDALLLNLVEMDGTGDMTFLRNLFKVPRPVCMDYF